MALPQNSTAKPRALRADAPDDHQDQVFRGGAQRQLPVDADAHVLREPVHQRLRGQHVLDLGGADAEAQRAERAVGGGVAVAADHHHAGADHAVLGRDDVLDALQRVVGVEQRNVVALAVAPEVAGLQRRGRVLDDAVAHRVRGNDVAHGRHVLPGHRDLAALCVQAGEGLRAGVLVHQVQVAEQQDVLRVEPHHGVRVDELAVEGAGRVIHARSSCVRNGIARASSLPGASSAM